MPGISRHGMALTPRHEAIPIPGNHRRCPHFQERPGYPPKRWPGRRSKGGQIRPGRHRANPYWPG